MKIQLPSMPNAEVRLRVFFDPPEKGRGRGTNASLTILCYGMKPVVIEARVTPLVGKDTFSRREGRRYVAQQLLKKMKVGFYNTAGLGYPITTKADRRVVFNAICPEFNQGGKDGRENSQAM